MLLVTGDRPPGLPEPAASAKSISRWRRREPHSQSRDDRTLTKAYMMSPDGRCKTFDASANGYVRGEGCGVVVLKRLSDAAPHTIVFWPSFAAARSTTTGGAMGCRRPTGRPKKRLSVPRLRDAGLAAAAHQLYRGPRHRNPPGRSHRNRGPANGFAPDRQADRPLLVGSVKTNIGHLESAAGIAGMAKIILSLRHGQIPPHLNLRNVNPLLRLEESPIEIPTAVRPWPQETEPRRAAVSSFGFGGTNGHVILEEAPSTMSTLCPGPQETTVERPCHLLTLSARSSQALSDAASATRHSWKNRPRRWPTLRIQPPWAARISRTAWQFQQLRAPKRPPRCDAILPSRQTLRPAGKRRPRSGPTDCFSFHGARRTVRRDGIVAVRNAARLPRNALSAAQNC